MPGTVLLLAASPVGKGRLVDAASVLSVLAAVPPPVLAGADTANVVELADPLEPQAVLTRLRAAAAAADGPLTVFVTGQVQLDRRQRLPHLALARTTPSTVRYTGFPWHWFREELRLRPAGATTTVFVDLHADAEMWGWLRGQAQVPGAGFDCGVGVEVFGRVAPPPGRRAVGAPTYMKAVATILRSGGRPGVERLHQMALARLAGEGEVGDLLLGAGAGGMDFAPAAPTRSRPLGAAAPNPPQSALNAPRPQTPPEGGLPEVGLPDGLGASAGPEGPDRPAGPEVLGVPVAQVAPAEPDVPGARVGSAEPDVAGVAVGSAEPGGLERPEDRPGAPVGSVGSDRLAVPAVPVGSAVQVGPGGSGRGGGVAEVDGDPHAAISTAVRSGRHGDADALAARWERGAAESHGVGSEEALHWAEVRADLAMFAGDAARSCRTWMEIAAARLAVGQAVDAPAVEAAVDRAHHQWGRIDDAGRARELGPALAELRGRVPGRRHGALDHVRRQLRQLQTQG